MNQIILTDFEFLVSQWHQMTAGLAITVGHLDTAGAEAEGDGERLNQLKQYQTGLVTLVTQKQNWAKKQLPELLLPDYTAMLFGFCAVCDDELLRRFPWPEDAQSNATLWRHHWLTLMLEKQIFGSRNAGTKLPKEIQQLSLQSGCQPEKVDLAEVYIHILGLGFGSQPGALSAAAISLKEALTELVKREDAGRSQVEEHQFGEQPKAGAEAQRLAPFSKWRKLAGRTAIAYVVVAVTFYTVLTVWLANSLEL